MRIRTLLVVGLLIVGCGGDETADAGTEPAPETTEAAMESTTTAASEPPVITMSDLSFSGVSAVAVGDTLQLVNEDDVPHTFTADDESFDVSIGAGETATFTFDEPGEVSYFCTIHPSMTGTITVEDAGATAGGEGSSQDAEETDSGEGATSPIPGY